MRLPVVAVLVRMLNMLMIMLEVRVRVHHTTLVRVLVSVRRGHPCPPFLARIALGENPNIDALIGPQSRSYTGSANCARPPPVRH
jgi:hypothetical protein